MYRTTVDLVRREFCHLVGALWRAAIGFFAHVCIGAFNKLRDGVKVVHENGLSGHNFIFFR
jgi:hypothetical protein